MGVPEEAAVVDRLRPWIGSVWQQVEDWERRRRWKA